MAGDKRQEYKLEARAIANLKHAHICVLYDIGRAEIEYGGSQIPDRKSQAEGRPVNQRYRDRQGAAGGIEGSDGEL